jgi:hypothetical protein
MAGECDQDEGATLAGGRVRERHWFVHAVGIKLLFLRLRERAASSV